MHKIWVQTWNFNTNTIQRQWYHKQMYFLTFHAFDVLSTNNVIIVYLSTHKSYECLTRDVLHIDVILYFVKTQWKMETYCPFVLIIYCSECRNPSTALDMSLDRHILSWSIVSSIDRYTIKSTNIFITVEGAIRNNVTQISMQI